MTVHDSMVKEGYECTSVDHSVHTRTTELGTSIVATHMDDMLVMASTIGEMVQLKADMWKYFKLVDLGLAHWLLGMNIKQDRNERTVLLCSITPLR